MTSHGVRVFSDMRAVEIANRNLKKVRMVGEVSILKVPAKCFRQKKNNKRPQLESLQVCLFHNLKSQWLQWTCFHDTF